jgi:hypothetical protein
MEAMRSAIVNSQAERFRRNRLVAKVSRKNPISAENRCPELLSSIGKNFASHRTLSGRLGVTADKRSTIPTLAIRKKVTHRLRCVRFEVDVTLTKV